MINHVRIKKKLEALFILSRFYLQQNNIDLVDATQAKIRHYVLMLLDT